MYSMENVGNTESIDCIIQIYDISFDCEYRKYSEDTKYREEFLKAFKLQDFDQEKLINNQMILVKQIEHERKFLRLLQKAAQKASLVIMDNSKSSDNDFGIMMLFSFEYFDFFHKCLKEYVNNKGTITEDFLQCYNELLTLLEN